MKYISEEIVKEILNKAELLEVVQDYLSVEKKGSSHVAQCPKCNKKGKFSINSVKDLWGCWSDSCDAGNGKGAISYLMEIEGMEYPKALATLAKKYNIDIDREDDVNTTKDRTKRQAFRDLQLLESGIPLDAQKYRLFTDSLKTVKFADRYQAATIDDFGKIKSGDDMILHYLDLNNQPITYRTDKGGEKVFYRVRWQNPSLHKSKEGKEMKYRSPFKSGSHLWIPNRVIEAHARGDTFETLYVIEGEKKADKMTLHGLMAVGVGGIHNFSFEGMTSHFEQIIKKCGVKNVVFIVDADWNELSKNDENVDFRPRTFASAVLKFRDYFFSYKNNGLYLNIYFGYGKDKALKGMDDMFVRAYKGKENELVQDLEQARIDREGKGEIVNIHNITVIQAAKIYEYWHLGSSLEFIKHHKEQLQGRKEFIVNKHRWNFNEEGEPQMIEKYTEDEKYWFEDTIEKQGVEKKIYSFNYYQSLKFLRNRGFGLYELGTNKYRMVRTEGKVIREIDQHVIQQYIKSFTEDLGEIGVLNMILKGGSQYLGPHQLSNMYYLKPEFITPEKDCQYMIFEKKYWKITANEITEGLISELPNSVWADKIIKFDAKIIPNFMNVQLVDEDKDNEHFDIVLSEECSKSDVYRFYLVTSDFNWSKELNVSVKNGKKRKYAKPKEQVEERTLQEKKDLIRHIVCKMLGTGYTIHEYRKLSQLKAIIPMDAAESEVGQSKGGTGKSIYSTMLEHVIPTIVIDGKKDLDKDAHLFDMADERTKLIVLDDVKANLDFNWLFSKITNGTEVNQKGMRRFLIQPTYHVPTNHAIRGSDPSTLRRQYLLSFSDFFEKDYTPEDFFGRLMFKEWEKEEWNRFYNFMAACIQTYLKYNDLNRFTIPQGDLVKRRLRQEIGENFLEFAEDYFCENEAAGLDTNPAVGGYRNVGLDKEKVYSDFCDKYPNDKKWATVRIIKQKVQSYCEYKGFRFTPNTNKEGRWKIQNTEYIVVADDNFNAEECQKLR